MWFERFPLLHSERDSFRAGLTAEEKMEKNNENKENKENKEEKENKENKENKEKEEGPQFKILLE